MKKEDFPIFRNNQGLVYLDNSATTQKPQPVLQAMTDFYEQYNANVHRGLHQLSQRATLAYETARQTIANFIGAETNEVIFTKGTTESINFLANTLVKPGDEIILTEMEHHSNLVPWQMAAKQRGAVIKYIPITADFILDMNRAKQLITDKTAIVSVTHLSNVLGTINPIAELARLAHQVGAILIVDAAQSVPHLAIDVKALNCDFLAFSGHKMCGPTGIGVLYGKKQLLQQLQPYQYGGGMIKEVTWQTSTWAGLPEALEAGTPPIAEAIGLAAAVNYLKMIGMKVIENYNHELTAYALKRLSSVAGLKIIGPVEVDRRCPVFSFILNDMHSHDLSEFLDQANVAVRSGTHCAMPLLTKLGLSDVTRASFYFYNDYNDVDALCRVLETAGINNKSEISVAPLTEEQELYKENILEHYNFPHNKGPLPQAKIVNKEFNPVCGDTITVYLQIENNKIANFTWEGSGCVVSQAAISLLSDELRQKSLREIKQMDQQIVLNLLGIPISHTRIKCALLSLKAVQGALL